MKDTPARHGRRAERTAAGHGCPRAERAEPAEPGRRHTAERADGSGRQRGASEGLSPKRRSTATRRAGRHGCRRKHWRGTMPSTASVTGWNAEQLHGPLLLAEEGTGKAPGFDRMTASSSTSLVRGLASPGGRFFAEDHSRFSFVPQTHAEASLGLVVTGSRSGGRFRGKGLKIQMCRKALYSISRWFWRGSRGPGEGL